MSTSKKEMTENGSMPNNRKGNDGYTHYMGTPTSSSENVKDMSNVMPMLLRRDLTAPAAKRIFAMVGLPGRGKSFIAMRLTSLYSWLGIESKIFNAGSLRRRLETACQDAAYFDFSNAESAKKREALAFQTLSEALAWLDERPEGYAIFDATNTTVDRRRNVVDFINRHNETHNQEYQAMFIESFCDDPEVLEANINLKLSRSPDYAHMDREEAYKDLVAREENYKKVYEPMGEGCKSESDLSYVKLMNLSSCMVAHRLYGRITLTLLPYLMALHIGSRKVLLMRMPHSEKQKVGGTSAVHEGTQSLHEGAMNTMLYGDESMSSQGEMFAKKLAAYMQGREDMAKFKIFACTHRRALRTASWIDQSGKQLIVHAALNPMVWGAYDGVPRSQFKEKTSPQWYQEFSADPMNTRFPGGESFSDFVRRLFPVVVEVEQHLEPVLIIAPLSTLQVLHCYFSRRPVKEATEVVIPQHAILEWTPDGGVFNESCITEAEICSASDP